MKSKKKEELSVSDYSIFQPISSRGIFYDYPDLRSVPTFKNLKDNEMLFVWYYACEASPYFKVISDRDRVKLCLEKSFLKTGKRQQFGPSDEDKYLNCNFPQKVIDAIEEMRKYKVGPRLMALKITEKSLVNIKALLDVDASNDALFYDKDNEVDWSKKKAFVDMIAKAEDVMPKLLNSLEGRYHLSEKKSSDDDNETNYLDEYHDNN